MFKSEIENVEFVSDLLDISLYIARTNDPKDHLTGLYEIINDKFSVNTFLYKSGNAFGFTSLPEFEVKEITKATGIFIDKQLSGKPFLLASSDSKVYDKINSEHRLGNLADIYRVGSTGIIILGLSEELGPKERDLMHKMLNRFHNHQISIEREQKKEEWINSKTEQCNSSSEHDLLNTILDNVPGNFLLFDQNRKIKLFNKSSEKHFWKSYKIKLESGINIFDLLEEEESKHYSEYYDRCLNGETVHFEHFSHHTSEKYSIVEFTPLRNNENEVEGVLSLTREITDLKNKEILLTANKAMLESILQTSNQAILALDLDLNILSINKWSQNDYRKLLNLNLKIGDNFKNSVSKEYFDGWHTRALKPLLDGEKRVEYIYNVNSKEDSRIIKVYGKNILDSNSEQIGYLFTATDITDFKRNEEELIESKATLQAILNTVPEEIYAIDKDYKIVAINNQAIDSFKQLGAEVAVGTVLSQVINEEEFNTWKIKYFDSIFDGKELSIKDVSEIEGKLKYVESLFRPVKDNKGEIIACLDVSKNITDLKQKEIELRKSEEQYKLLVETSPNGIALVGVNGDNLYVSNRNAAIHGYEPEERVGKSVFELILPEDHGKIKYFLNTLVDSREAQEVIFRTRHKSGRVIWLEGTAITVRDNRDVGYAYLFVFNDVTERMKVRMALEESEKKYKELIELSSYGIMIIDEIGNISYASTHALQIMQSKESEIINQCIFNHITENAKNWYLDAVKSFNGKERVKDFSLIVNGKNGSKFYLDGFLRFKANEKGEFENCLISFHDNTAKKQAEKELQATQIYYSNMYENMFNPIIVYDFKSNKVLDSNRAASALFGKSKEEINDFSWNEIFLKESKAYIELFLRDELEFVQKNISESKPYSFISVVKVNEQREAIVKTNVIPTYRNKEEGFIILHDVTQDIVANRELQKINQELEEQFAIYDSLVSNSFDGIDIIELSEESKQDELSGKLLVRNQRMLKFLDNSKDLNFSNEEITFFKQRISEKMVSDKVNSNSESQKLTEGTKFQHEIKVENEHQSFNVIVSNQLLDVNDKRLLIRQYHNITEKVHQQQIIEEQIIDLNLKNDTLEQYIESNLQLENFAYIASHDLKAPLRSVASFSQLLRSRCYNDLDEKGKSFLDIVIQSSENMLILIEDLLTFSRVNAKKKAMGKVDLNSILKRIILNLDTQIEEAKATINVSDMPEIIADESMMIQIFQNLISNAIKFRPVDKSPVINVSVKEQASEWVFSVQDNGIGVKTEDIKKIFNIFTKLHSGNRYDGNGLGLTICKKIAEKHGGKIWLDSNPGEGSIFQFSIMKTFN